MPPFMYQSLAGNRVRSLFGFGVLPLMSFFLPYRLIALDTAKLELAGRFLFFNPAQFLAFRTINFFHIQNYQMIFPSLF